MPYSDLEVEEDVSMSDVDSESENDENDESDEDNTSPAALFAAKLQGKHKQYLLPFSQMVDGVVMTGKTDIELSQINYEIFRERLGSYAKLKLRNGWWFEWTCMAADSKDYAYKVNSTPRLQCMIGEVNKLGRKAEDPRSVLYRLVYRKGPASTATDENWYAF